MAATTTTPTSNLPPAPVQGMQIWVQTGSHYSIGDGHTVARVNSRSFYVRAGRKTTRYPLAQWTTWLNDRFAEGAVHLGGKLLQSPLHPAPSASTQVDDAEDFSVRVRARDLRFLRGARDVLKNYRLERQPPTAAAADVARVVVERGRRRYTVEFALDWSRPPRCSCPDAQQGGARHAAGFCKHAIASALKWEDLRCQLLDLML